MKEQPSTTDTTTWQQCEQRNNQRRRRIPIVGVLLAAALASVTLLGCTSQQNDESEAEAETPFSYSDGIDENGFWEGITALDHVELFDYDHMTIPSEMHTVSDSDVQTEIDSLLSSYSTSQEITDRAVADGDTVNIDYVGSIDGVEFDGGSTGGAGTEVTIGTTSYIDDFLEQLIGHMPGENFDISVTFPEDYGNEELNGKDAVFNVTINNIVETVDAELTDGFVSENLSASYGWTTIKEMEEGIQADLEAEAAKGYIQDYLANEVTVNDMPESLIEYQQNSMIASYEYYAEMYGMEFDEFLSSYVGVSSREELLENNYDNFVQSANYYLVIQAIAEDADFSASTDDVANFFLENYGSEDYTTYEEEYGLPFLKQMIIGQNVLDYLIEHAELA